MKFNDLFKVLAISAFWAALMWAEDQFLEEKPVLHIYKWYLLAFFGIQSLMTVFITSYGLKKDRKYFQNFFFGSVVLRMVLSIFVIFWMIYQGVISPLQFIVTFFALYFSFVAFEIYSLLINLRAKHK